MSSDLLDLSALMLVVLAAMLSPGPDMLLIARYALRARSADAFACIAGITAGIGCHVVFALTGLAALASTAPELLDVVRWLGALWLACLGLMALRSTGKLRFDGADDGHRREVHPFTAGLLSNLLNVKVLLMMLALFTELLDPGAPIAVRSLGAGLLIAEVALVWTLFAFMIRTAPVQRFLQQRARALDRVFGTLLLVIATLLALGGSGS